jgi:hypothetical protein
MKKILLLLSLLAVPFVFQHCCRDEVRNYSIDDFQVYMVKDSLFDELADNDSLALGQHAFRAVPEVRVAQNYGAGSLMALTCYQTYRSLSGIQSIQLLAEDGTFPGIRPGDSLQHLAEFKQYGMHFSPDSGWMDAGKLAAAMNDQMREGASVRSHGMPRLEFLFRFKQATAPGRHRVQLRVKLSDGREALGQTESFVIY